MSFKANIFLSIFCLDDLFFDESGVLKSTTIFVLLSIFPLCLWIFPFMYLGTPMLDAYMTMIVTSC